MANSRKDAGEARQRPRPQVIPSAATAARTPTARPAAIAPSFDATTGQPTPQGGSHKGMISNPWVKHWTGRGPEPDASAKGPGRPTGAPAGKGRSRGRASAKGTSAPNASPPASINAGRAPRRARGKPS